MRFLPKILCLQESFVGIVAFSSESLDVGESSVKAICFLVGGSDVCMAQRRIVKDQ